MLFEFAAGAKEKVFLFVIIFAKSLAFPGSAASKGTYINRHNNALIKPGKKLTAKGQVKIVVHWRE